MYISKVDVEKKEISISNEPFEEMPNIPTSGVAELLGYRIGQTWEFTKLNDGHIKVTMRRA